MKILGIDTSTKFLSLGIYDNGKIYQYNLEVLTKLSFLLTPTIKRILDALGWQVKDIDYLACGIGPGSFTGIRLGLSAIKGISWSLGKPVIGISSLDILAKNMFFDKRPLVAVVDAKRNLVYCGIFKIENGSLKKVKPYMLLTINEFCKYVPDNSIITGDALSLYKEVIVKNLKGATILDKDYWYPKGHNIISLALDRIRNKKLNNAFDLKPIYLYPKVCQIRERKA
jgi:tRNA threonylcarbamoyladenosine biosynthesis protein TsaB